MKYNRKNLQCGAAAQRLLKIAGDALDIDEAIRIIVGNLTKDIECPPTNLNAIAQRLGVSDIFSDDIAVSGELRRNGKKLNIRYSKYLSPTRKQFTIAHELGHAIFENSGPHPPRKGEEVERLCDLLASEILMPEEVFSTFTDNDPSIVNLFQVSRLFKTSLQSTSIRYTKAKKKVTVFYMEDDEIAWGYGIVRKGKLRPLHYNLKVIGRK
jgi:Zn-dependent peptidase ImmA (M78 family)